MHLVTHYQCFPYHSFEGQSAPRMKTPASAEQALYQFIPNTSVYLPYDMNFSYTPTPLLMVGTWQTALFQRGPFSLLHRKRASL